MIQFRLFSLMLTIVGLVVATAAFRATSADAPRIGTVTSAQPMLAPFCCARERCSSRAVGSLVTDVQIPPNSPNPQWGSSRLLPQE